MPPCFDVYVWIRTDERAETLSRFIDRYVDGADPGDPRFAAFVRTFVEQRPAREDADALADLRRDANARTAFSLYLRGKGYHEAIITLTEDGELVLGLGLDDPVNDPEIQRKAGEVLASMLDEFQGSAGIGGVELAPPQSAAEWHEDGLVMLRVGSI